MTRARFGSFGFLLGCALYAPAFAQSVSVENAWVRSTVAAQTSTGAYLDITSRETAALIGVSTPIAAAVEMHEMRVDGNIMKMRAVDRLELPAGKAVKLSPGAYHLMLLGLKHPVNAGGSVPLTLEIEAKDGKRSKVEIKAEVRRAAAERQP